MDTVLTRLHVKKLIYEAYPEDLLCIPIEVLRQAYQSDSSPDMKIAIIAELFVRDFLSYHTDRESIDFINAALPNGELEKARLSMTGPSYHPSKLDHYSLWDGSDNFSICCMTAVQERLRDLFKADGVIPVFLNDQAFLVPFHFEDNHGNCGVFDLHGNEITEWSSYAQQLGIDSQVVIHYTLRDFLPTLQGNSMMLPLQMAWWRTQGDLPEYDIFRTLATGAFDNDMRLQDVDTVVKETLIGSILKAGGNAAYFRPKSLRDNQSPCGTVLIDRALPREKVLGELRGELEKRVKSSLRYAMDHLKKFSSLVRYDSYCQWDGVITRLENAASFDDHNPAHAEAYLVNLNLRSEAYCHDGQTQNAMALNRKAISFAEKHKDKLPDGFQYNLLFAKIDRLVQLQDCEDIAEALQEAHVIQQEVAAFKDKDLLMRYYGTMGQVYWCAALLGMPDVTPEMSLECIEKAVEYAEQIGKLGDISQDKNYLHMYYAIFAPGSLDEREALRQAENVIDRLDQENHESATKSRYFLKRQQAFAWYRYMLRNNGKCHPGYRVDNILKAMLYGNDKQRAVPWLCATTGKYLGAIEAARGNVDEARRHFCAADAAFGGKFDSYFLSIIGLTVRAEAFRSLKDEAWLLSARQLLASLPDDARKYVAFSRWRDYIDNPTDEKFPALSYWY